MKPNRMALKAALRDRMLSLEEAELKAAIEHYEAHLRDAQLDAREFHDKDDLAEAAAEVGMAEAFDQPAHTHQAKLAAIQAIDFSLAETARPGAVVSFDGRNFIVSVSTTRFDCEGETYMGVSANSPAYRAFEGLRAGETFVLNNREITLDDVF